MQTNGIVLCSLLACTAACGARTGLPSEAREDSGDSAPPVTPPSGEFCDRATYRSGYRDLSLYLLLDKSGSMRLDEKWDQATIALSAFVADPDAAGIGLGLQYFPLKTSCDSQQYAIPAVPIAPLPENGPHIIASLAAQRPEGATPTLPALRGAIEHARALLTVDPFHAIVVAILTDGTPNSCDSTIASVARIAADGMRAEPQVLTFVVGLESGFVEDMQDIATAGGTGEPIFVGASPGSAERLVDALKFLRDTQTLCRYAVPGIADVQLASTDISVALRVTPDDPEIRLGQISDSSQCGSSDSAYFVDDPFQPKRVELCPRACDRVHTSPVSRITVSAGCGEGEPDAGPRPDGGVGDGGPCSGIVTFQCVSSCDSGDKTMPICVGGSWRCPDGMVSTDTCGVCPVVPHMCCKADGTLVEAGCFNGDWICPPGVPIYGTEGCVQPFVCGGGIPCAVGELCRIRDFLCGASQLAGSCEPRPASCPSGGTPVCGCNGTVYDNECMATSAGVDLSTLDGDCAVPPGRFSCGPLFCRTTTQVCSQTVDLNKIFGRDQFACIEEVASCPTGCGCNLCADACPAGRTCVESCSQDGMARFLTCTQI